MAPAEQLWLPLNLGGEAPTGSPVTGGPVHRGGLMAKAVERDNLFRALRKVAANGGSPGIDGMGVKGLKPYLKEHWPRIRGELVAGR